MSQSDNQPLATKMRPTTLDEFIGQKKLISKDGILTKLIESDQIPSMIFWGPPASGKTTLAKIIATTTGSDFIELSAVLDGKEKLKIAIARAKQNLQLEQKTILFIDEIHRWSKSQQDTLLPFVESGLLTLIGATTENPSFTIIDALLSRTRVFVFEAHNSNDILLALQSAKSKYFSDVIISDTDMQYIADLASGDMRFALNSFEITIKLSKNNKIDRISIESAMNKFLKYDKDGDWHYNIISAVHKAMRSSSPTASVYWVMRMLESGDDPLYIARRLVRFAAEDIGNASPTALILAVNVFTACQQLGMPECAVHLVQLAEYLARAPKSNNSYTALKQAQSDIAEFPDLEVPIHLRNAPNKFMKSLGNGKGYEYDHDLDSKQSSQQTMPDKLAGRDYFA